MEAYSTLSGVVKYLSSTRGDLTNLSAPPFLLAPMSVVEIGSCWTQRPELFAAPAKETDPAMRALRVLKNFLVSLKSQLYIGGDQNASIKKPLNAFLGELFFGTWKDDVATAHLAAEQVSHHPPITAVYMWDEENGIWGEGYTRVGMSFSGGIDIKQTGHSIVHIDRYDEDYLLPQPSARIEGFLYGVLYPELYGTYHIVSSSGYISEIIFEGQGYIRGAKNSFTAKVYKRDDETKTAIYVLQGQWSGTFTIRDAIGQCVEIYDTNSEDNKPAELVATPVKEQDPWETHKAWEHVHAGLRDGDMGKIVKEKARVEKAQRKMRAKDALKGRTWTPLLFAPAEGEYKVFNELGSAVGMKLNEQKTRGVWKVDREKVKNLKRPFRGTLTPLG